MIAPCYAISIKSHTDRQTDRATTRGPIGPKNVPRAISPCYNTVTQGW